jgi:hypothetical protein
MEPDLGDALPAPGEMQRSLVREKFGVLGCEVLQFLGKVLGGVNRVGRADRHAGSAIDAAFRVDVELSRRFEPRLVFLRVNAVGGADIDTEKIFDARVRDYISHDEVFLNVNWGLATSPGSESN